MLGSLPSAPAGVLFRRCVSANLRLAEPPCPVPFAVSYRVGESVPDGTVVAIWRRLLYVGIALPILPLALTVSDSVPIDLRDNLRRSRAAGLSRLINAHPRGWNFA